MILKVKCQWKAEMFLCLRIQQFTQVHFRVIRIWNKPLSDVAQIGLYYSWFACLLVFWEKKMLSVLRAALLQCTFPCQKIHFLDCSKQLLEDAVNQFSTHYATSASTPVNLLSVKFKSLCWRGSTIMHWRALKREKEGKRERKKKANVFQYKVQNAPENEFVLMITSYVNWLLIQRQTSHWVSIEIEINMQPSTDLSKVVHYLRELWRLFSSQCGQCAHILGFLFPPCSFRKEEQDMALPLA